MRGSEWVEGKAWSEQKSTNNTLKLEHRVPRVDKRTQSLQNTTRRHVSYANIHLTYANEQDT